MQYLEIITGENNPKLRKNSAEVQKISQQEKKIIQQMKITIDKKKGIGLAAPQVGILKRIILAKINGKKIVMINPKITEFSLQEKSMEEGCLSIPGFFAQVIRSTEIQVKFQDEDFVEQILNLSDIDARVVQHEIDHLNGILFVDRIETKKF